MYSLGWVCIIYTCWNTLKLFNKSYSKKRSLIMFIYLRFFLMYFYKKNIS